MSAFFLPVRAVFYPIPAHDIILPFYPNFAICVSFSPNSALEGRFLRFMSMRPFSPYSAMSGAFGQTLPHERLCVLSEFRRRRHICSVLRTPPEWARGIFFSELCPMTAFFLACDKVTHLRQIFDSHFYL